MGKMPRITFRHDLCKSELMKQVGLKVRGGTEKREK